MDARFMYPYQNCKILHLVRHGQALHNLQAQKDPDSLASPPIFDPSLCPLGWQQVEDLRKKVAESRLLNRVELVVTSPLLRTMQTASGVFGCNENGRSAPSRPPIVALDLARNRNGERLANMRRSVTECRPLFPAVDFSLMESDDDNLWRPVRESEEEFSARAREFINWLWTRPEKEIVVVSHGIFLKQIPHVLENDRNSNVKNDLCESFKNCELRSVVVIEETLDQERNFA